MAGLLKKKQRLAGEIPTASMADIAFLLLIFFLLVTTIDVDTGIGMVLPPKLEQDVEPPPIKERNMLAILVNAQGQVLVEGKSSAVNLIREEVKKHTLNQGRDPAYAEAMEKAIVSLKTDQQTPYHTYIAVVDEIMMAYQELRDAVARQEFGEPNYASYKAKHPDDDTIKERIKIRLSIAEPDPGTGAPS